MSLDTKTPYKNTYGEPEKLHLLHDTEDEVRKELSYDFKSAINRLWSENKDLLPMHEFRKLLVDSVYDYFAFGADGKFCTRCKDTKNRGEFGADNSKPDGLFYWCRACRRKRDEELGQCSSV